MKDAAERIVTEGFTGEVDVYLAEDNDSVMAVLVDALRMILGDRIKRIIWMVSLKEVDEKLSSAEENHVWITDIGLVGGDINIETMREVLANRSYNTGWIILSGSSANEIRREVGDIPFDSPLKVWCLQKPVNLGTMKVSTEGALDHVNGNGNDVTELETVELPRVGVTSLSKPLKDFENLADLVRFLPANSGQVVSENAQYDLCGLIARKFEELLVLAGRSYEEFRDRWFAIFPRERDLSRRDCLLGLLHNLTGAEYVLDICIHDINNILAQFNGDGPTPKQWDEVLSDIQIILGRSGRPFKKYHHSPTEGRCFWEKQDVNKVIEQVGDHFTYVSVDVPEGVLVYCPAGSLMSMIRTFYSNFEKVKRLSEQEEAELELFVYAHGGQVIFQISDNLKEFGDDQLKGLFDGEIRSESGAYGMGTGLVRTAEIIKLSNGQVDSYHHRASLAYWIKKSPKGPPRQVDSNAVPTTRVGMRKVFEFTLPLSSGE